MGGHEENYGTRTLKYEIAKSLRLFDLGISTGLVDSRIATLKSHPSHVKEIGFESDNLRVIGQPPIKAALELVETTTLSKEEFFARGSWFWNQHDEKYYYDQMRQVFTNFNNQINSNRSLEEIAEEFDLDHVKKYLTYISKFQSFNIVDLDFALIETGTQKEFDVVSYIASGFPNQVGLDTTHLVDSGSLDEMRTLARDYPHAQIYLFPKCVDQKMLEVIPGFLAWSYVPLLGIRSFVIPNDTYNPKPSTAADLENILEICSVQGVRSHKVIPKEEIGVVVTPMPRISGLEDDEKVDLLYAFKMHFGSELVGNSTFETVTSDTSSGFVGRYGKVIYKSGQIDQLITERDVIQVLEKDDFLQSRIANLVKISTIASGIANAVGQPFLFTKLNHSFVQRLDYKPHNMETKFVEKLRQVFGFNDCYEDPLMQRIFTLAYLHGELNPQIFPDTLPTTYHDFSTSEIREDHKYLGRRVIQMCQNASDAQRKQFESRRNSLVFTHGDAKWDNWHDGVTLIDFGSAKISTEYKDVAKSMLDFNCVTDPSSVTNLLNCYYQLRSITKRKVEEPFVIFGKNVMEALITESVRTIHYKRDSNPSLGNYLVRVANVYIRELSQLKKQLKRLN